MLRAHTAIARCAEGTQVEGAKLGLQHNLGLGGACVVTLYERV
jgi:sterol carrier protein 2